MAACLKSIGFEVSNADTLIGFVSWERMRNAILRFFTDKTTNPKDILLFYFSGHGIPEDTGQHYLSTSQTDPDEPYYHGFQFDDLTSFIGRSNSRRKIIILDCCYSGSARLERSDTKGQIKAASKGRINIAQKIKESRAEGSYLLASCQGSQEAYSTIKGDYSLYTHYIINGLLGGHGRSVDREGNVTPISLGNYAWNEIVGLPFKERMQYMYRILHLVEQSLYLQQ